MKSQAPVSALKCRPSEHVTMVGVPSLHFQNLSQSDSSGHGLTQSSSQSTGGMTGGHMVVGGHVVGGGHGVSVGSGVLSVGGGLVGSLPSQFTFSGQSQTLKYDTNWYSFTILQLTHCDRQPLQSGYTLVRCHLLAA